MSKTLENILVFHYFNDDYLFNNQSSIKKILVTKDDLVYGVGENIYGILGLGPNREISEPTIVPELCNKQIIEFNNGWYHCIARSIDGKLFSFGSNEFKQLGYKTENKYNNRPKLIECLINENVIQVSCGKYHTIVLTRNGKVFGWGDNSCGQIGINSEEEFISNPTNICGFNGEKIRSISCGFFHSTALTVNGYVFSWGLNSCGQLGINSTKSSIFPQIIQMIDKNVLFKKISCGQCHNLLLSIDNDIYYYGLNRNYSLHDVRLGLKQCIPHIIETTPKICFSDILCRYDRGFNIALSQFENICYIWGRIKDKFILFPKKTQYKSCRVAMDEIIGSTSELQVESIINDNRFQNEFKEIQYLSEGMFGVVFKATKISDNKCYAIKRIVFNEVEKQKLLNEIEFFSRLKSEFIVKYEQSWVESNENFLYIQMELCLKTLKQFNQELKQELGINSLIDTPISFYIISDLMTEVIEGLSFLHKNKIIHRDLKPQNVMITDFKNGRSVKIADFGISCIHETNFTNNDYLGISHTGDVGDLKYMAPELVKRSDRLSGRWVYDEKVDIYSLAVIFDDLIGNNCLHEIQNTVFVQLKNTKIKNLKEIIEIMKNNPEERPDCEELLRNKSKYFIDLLDLIETKEINIQLTDDSGLSAKYLEYKFFNYLTYGYFMPKNLPQMLSFIIKPKMIDFNKGLHHCIARTIEGKLFSFGSNEFKQLGYETENKYNNRPKIIECLINENVKQVRCGKYHTIVLTQKGEVYGWGDNSCGQIGINTEEKFISIPNKIIGFNGEKIQSISSGFFHSMALTVNGNVFSWGINSCGQLGINSTDNSLSPRIIKIRDKVLFKKISCGSDHSLLLSKNGEIYSFGLNHCNQLGYKTHKESYSKIPRMIEMKPIINFSDICCLYNQSISTALSSTDGYCYIWGNCEKQVIKSLKKTEYISCEEALFNFTNKTVKAYSFKSSLDAPNNFFNTNYLVFGKISKSSYGEVLMCENRETKELSAVKKIEIYIKQIEKIVREIEVISQLKYESIILYKQSWIECNESKVNFLYLEMELCLKTFIELKEQMFKELNCKSSICESIIGLHIMSELMKEVIEGLAYLHKNNIIHRDLKPQNILINDNTINGKYIRISDFGLSRIHDCEDQSLSADIRTIKYMAPELILSITEGSGRIFYTNKVDIYSTGKIFELDCDFSQQKFDSSKTDNKIGNFQRMLTTMLSKVPKMRPNCEQILNKYNKGLIIDNKMEVTKVLQKLVLK